MGEWPEHEKLQVIQPFSQTIGQFIDWLSEVKKIHLAEWVDTECEACGEPEQRLMFARVKDTDLLAEYFKIDQDKLEAEKRAMIEVMRTANE